MGARAAELLDLVVRAPRPAGSRAEADARADCARLLSAHGFTVVERPFDYSAFPGHMAMPAGGTALLAAALWLLARIRAPEARPTASLGIALAVAAGVAVFSSWIARFGTVRWPWSRTRGVNLEGARGVPRVWLVAHLDTKTQPIPLLLRAGGVIASAAAWGMLLVVWVASGQLTVPRVIVLVLAAVAALAAVPLMLSVVTARSAGALDNGSGVATVLRAVELTPRDMPLGVLLTTAEELGLAGARAWVAGRAPAVALNCDGVDDIGRVSVTIARDGSDTLRRAACEVADALHLFPSLVVRRGAPGVLLDAIAFANAGWTAATVSRGGWRSLARVHTRADERDRLRGDGVEEVARLLVGIAGAMITEPERSGPTRITSGGDGASCE